MIKKEKIVIINNKNKVKKYNINNSVLNISLKKIIEIKCSFLDFYELNEIIDCAIYICNNYNNFIYLFKKKHKTEKKIDILSYFYSQYIIKNPLYLPLIKSLITLPRKQKDLLDTYFRLTNNNNILLYKILNNKHKILEGINII